MALPLNRKPSPMDLINRWPLAIVAVSQRMNMGDAKYANDGRDTNERGSTLDMDKYGYDYSVEKMLRHLALISDIGSSDHDDEDGLHHVVAVAWHALNACEAIMRSEYSSVDGFLEQITEGVGVHHG